MSKHLLYQSLYPHLNLTRLAGRVTEQPRSSLQQALRSNSSGSQTRSVSIEPPKPEPKPSPKIVKKVTIVDEPKVVQPEPVVKAVEPEPPKVDSPKPPPKKVRDKALSVKDMTPIAETVYPVKGQRGLQKRYTEEQRRDIYLSQLSKKSVKKAEEEVGKISQFLETVDFDRAKLKEEEKAIKKRLKLVNRAMFFTGDNIKPKDESNRTNETPSTNSAELLQGSDHEEDSLSANAED